MFDQISWNRQKFLTNFFRFPTIPRNLLGAIWRVVLSAEKFSNVIWNQNRIDDGVRIRAAANRELQRQKPNFIFLRRGIAKEFLRFRQSISGHRWPSL